MTTPQTPAPQAGPELDAEIWALLGYPKPLIPPEYFRLGEVQFPWHFVGFNGNDPIWNVAAISTDPGAAFRALEMWRDAGDHRTAEVRFFARAVSPKCRCILAVKGQSVGFIRADTFPLAAALALRAALGGKA